MAAQGDGEKLKEKKNPSKLSHASKTTLMMFGQ